MPKQPLVVLWTAAILAMQCTRDFSVEPSPHQVRELTPLEKRLSDTGNQFGLKLFAELARQEEGRNVFFSPLSVAMALGMAFNGAAGTTEQAFRQTLQLGELSTEEINSSFRSLIELLTQLDPSVTMEIANSVWYRLGFYVEPEFVRLNSTYFGAQVQALNFDLPGAPATINAWVKDKTHGRIASIVDRIDPLTMLYLINAIYFKGTWTRKFDPNRTQDDLFTASDGSQMPCRMMAQEGEFSYFENEDVQAVDLPYGNRMFSMVVLLPKSGVSLDALVVGLDAEKWSRWIGLFATRKGLLQLPKFKLEYEAGLKPALSALGLAEAFTDTANFTRINPQGNLYISEVKHKSFVEVDEKGTEAAAATAVVIGVTSVDPSLFVMRVDRPFLFAIRDRHSGTVLFIGKVVKLA
ncbi:MAG: serpin family protein [candidate division KSB1 bacterium]|nr:serpin family protein [candidate division KSB1 bacterium]MDZ7393434.1 serpin family protein [candidate division KSB1 bacterium]